MITNERDYIMNTMTNAQKADRLAIIKEVHDSSQSTTSDWHDVGG